MKIIKLRKVHKRNYGRVVINNHDLESHERDTIFFLASLGFDIETIIPSHIPGSKNPDLLMLGTTWEMKGPRTANETTITTKFRKAVKQSGGRAIFDLRTAREDVFEIERYIMKLFKSTRGMKRIIIVRNNDDAIDIFK